MEEAKKLLLEKQPELTSLLLTLVKDTKKGGACETAERAWKDARASAWKDHVLEATLAFIKKWPGVEDGNPCAVAGNDY